MVRSIGTPIFTIGELIEINNLHKAYILEIDNDDDGDLVFKVKFLVGNNIVSNVPAKDCRVISLQTNATTRSDTSRHRTTLGSITNRVNNRQSNNNTNCRSSNNASNISTQTRVTNNDNNHRECQTLKRSIVVIV